MAKYRNRRTPEPYRRATKDEYFEKKKALAEIVPISNESLTTVTSDENSSELEKTTEELIDYLPAAEGHTNYTDRPNMCPIEKKEYGVIMPVKGMHAGEKCNFYPCPHCKGYLLKKKLVVKSKK